ncbi:MAG: hypothetical protein QM817_05565 [Archangium sp.]
MNKWVMVALAVGGVCVLCCGSLMVLGLVADDTRSSSGGSASGGARSVPSGCSDTFDGWHQEITDRGLVLTKDGLQAELPWPLEFTAELRNGDPDANVWRAVLGDRYEPGQLTSGQYGERRLAGPATERATGRSVYVVFAPGAVNGIASPVAVIGNDAAALNAQFPTSGELMALQNLNRFSLGCAAVAGRWKSGFNSVSERYSATTGQFIGVQTAAAWRDMSLEEGGSFQRESSALLNGVFHKSSDSGSWSNGDWSFVLDRDGAEKIEFNAAFVAVQNGFLLRLQNRKFTSDVEEFARVE